MTMPSLPRPRGEISRALLADLVEDVHSVAQVDPPRVARPLADEDLQLALYLCYELHYRGLPGVDDAWEWEPTLLALRRQLEDCFESALLDAVP
ncbi:MAG: hypothetical protein QOJ55_1333, partial [Solirubrobacteraceae bacterium]|nr:hypothetical protein [Solirubrobacteraceae bacterium]